MYFSIELGNMHLNNMIMIIEILKRNGTQGS
jgi:hypothetical protein